jgi:Rrf2 family protein
MPVSAKAEYACLAMLELAARYTDPKPARLADVAERHAIPQRFLVQILIQLRNDGLVTTTRGQSGGYRLARSPAEITLADIVAALEGWGEIEEKRAGGSALGQTLAGVWVGLGKTLADARAGYLRRFRLSDLLPANGPADYVI